MLLRNIASLCGLALLLAACGDKPVASVSGGECKAFQRVAVEACGLTPADQNVLDDYVETGVGACKWRRPAERTPSCADLRGEIATLRADAAKAEMSSTPVNAPAAAPVVKPSLFKRIFKRGK